MEDRTLFVTEAGLRRLENELQELRAARRSEVAERVRELQANGRKIDEDEGEDNSTEASFLDERIALLQYVVGAAVPLSAEEIPTDYVGLGSQVTLRDLESDDTWELRVVSSAEADPLRDWISSECPVGAALLNKRVGETIEVEAPVGLLRYEVLSLARPSFETGEEAYLQAA